MVRSLRQKIRETREHGQALALFAAAFVVFLGFVAMSIDVGRYMWAKSQMQAAVDGASLAGAQSMVISQNEAQTYATTYWNDNAGFIKSNGQNVAFTIAYPDGNRAVQVTGSADIPTWFAKFFGIDSWHVTATGKAESQVLDIALVLDISGSMCFGSYGQTESSNSIYVMSPGRLTPSGGYGFPKLASPISASTNNSITIKLTDVGIFSTTSSSTKKSNFGNDWNVSSKRYHEVDPDGSGSGRGARAGMIMIDNELFQITSVNSSKKELTVTRAMKNNYTGVTTVKAAHAAGAEVWALRHGGAFSTGSSDYCDAASYYAASNSVNGPHQPFDGMIDAAKYFTSLFNKDYDKIGLASYSSAASNERSLTATYSQVTSSMDAIHFPTGGTNIAHGIGVGRQIIKGTGSRVNSTRVLVLLTDGVPNVYCTNGYNGTSCSQASSTSPTSCPASSTAISHAVSQASSAKSERITVYTIGLGPEVLDCVLEDIAAAGGGEYLKAPTTAQLDDVFKEIAEKTRIALTQ